MASQITTIPLTLKALTSRRHHQPTSPVAHLLPSNTAPSESDASLIRDLITSAQEELEALETKMASKSKSKAKFNLVLKSKATACVASLNAHKALLSPLRRLPSEVWELIFLEHHSYNSQISWGLFRWGHLSWAITQVCSQWRKIALGRPGLWNRIPKLKFDKRTMKKSYLDFVKMVLRRSQDVPLLVYIHAPSTKFANHPLVAIVVDHCERWKYLLVTMNGVSKMAAFKGAKGRFASLRTLKLDIQHTDRGGTLDLFEDAPSLQTVHLTGGYPDGILLPWAQLTSYVECPFFKGVDHSLELTSSLRHLELGHLCSQFPPISPLRLPHLLTLKLTYCLLPSDPFFKQLTLPSLEELSIMNRYEEGALVQTIHDLIKRSTDQSRIKKLRFCQGLVDEGALTRLLQLTPQLIMLACDFPPALDLVNLIATDPLPVLVPHLQSLEFHVSELGENGDVLTALAKSRCEKFDAGDVASTHLDDDGCGVPELQIALLTDFQLLLSSPKARQQAQVKIHRWDEALKPDGVWKVLQYWSSDLLEVLPDLEVCDPGHKSVSIILRSRRLERICAALADVDIADVNQLYVSGLPFFLYHLSELETAKTPNVHKIRQRLETLTQKWEPLIKQSLPQTFWMRKDCNRLKYVPGHDGKQGTSESE